ncbi:MAG: DUF1292 domain-containing protein [Candidatus Izemoplasmatales bacterium]|nr:DUF1292 domain-containing protein [Candidatus Izemoplasmatales bacterium]
MTDKEIYLFLVDDTSNGILTLKDDDGTSFELEQLGLIPMHGVLYAIMDLKKIEGKEVTEEEAGIVLLELDMDEEEDMYYVQTVEDDELFDEVMDAFEALPLE